MQRGYSKWFFIEESVWNNAFSFEKRKSKRLFVPNIIDIQNFDEIDLQNSKEKITFEDFDFKWNLITAYWLKNFYRIHWKWKEIILVDNHNHTFYFWYEARNRGIISDNNILFHIDEHSDMKDNGKYLFKSDSCDLRKVFSFTNYVLNVGDYIVPALKEGIIVKVVQMRSEISLQEISSLKKIDEEKWIILNLDLDFFEPKLDYIDYDLKKKVILEIAEKADVITVASSPFFINQELALEIFRDIFW